MELTNYEDAKTAPAVRAVKVRFGNVRYPQSAL